MIDVQTWSPPGATGPVISRRRRVEDLNYLEREAWERGHADGHAAGLIEARREQKALTDQLGAQVQNLGAILELMTRPLEALDAAVEQQLATAAACIARGVVRQELKTDPARIIALVRECVGRLPIAAREVRVHVHPEDAALIRQFLATPQQDRVWQLMEDPVLSRGGCLVSSENSSVDARLESLLMTAIGALLGEERGGDAARGATP
jgi:flagellar assembly protein FliH